MPGTDRDNASYYGPLDYSEDEIRLLKVDLEHGSCELKSNVSLRRSKPQFIALSYTWGDQANTTMIVINGRSRWISRNLDSALQDVISMWKKSYGLHGKPLFLWCDQICINQSHNEEKNHQVAFMRTIYERAEEVLVWLPVNVVDGLDVDFQRTAFASDDRLDTWVKWRQWHEDQLEKSYPWNPYQNRQQMIYSTSSLKTGDTEKDAAAAKDLIKACTSVCSIVQSAWWLRAWVYQEFIVATRARFLVCELSVSWQELYTFLRLALSKIERHISATEMVYDDLGNECARLEAEIDHSRMKAAEMETGFRRACPPLDECSRAAIGCNWQFWEPVSDHCDGSNWWLQLVTLLCTIPVSAISLPIAVPLYLLASISIGCLRSVNKRTLEIERRYWKKAEFHKRVLQPHLNALKETRERWNLVDLALRSKFDTTSTSNYMPLSKLILHARNTLCADPRDKIFAFIGLTDPKYNIQADYSSRNTVYQTLPEAAAAIISTEHTLNILQLATEDRGVSTSDPWGSPSWVPDITVPFNSDSEHMRFLRMIEIPMSDCNAAKDRKLEVSFGPDVQGNENRILTAKGIRVDYLQQLIEDNPGEPRRRFRGKSTYEIVTKNTAREGDEVWVLCGLDVPLTLSRPSPRDPHYTIIGPAVVYEGGEISGVMHGSLIAKFDDGEVYAEAVSIV